MFTFLFSLLYYALKMWFQALVGVKSASPHCVPTEASVAWRSQPSGLPVRQFSAVKSVSYVGVEYNVCMRSKR